MRTAGPRNVTEAAPPAPRSDPARTDTPALPPFRPPHGRSYRTGEHQHQRIPARSIRDSHPEPALTEAHVRSRTLTITQPGTVAVMNGSGSAMMARMADEAAPRTAASVPRVERRM